MRRFVLAAAVVVVAALAPTRAHAQGVRCKDGTVWSASKGRVACGGHGGVVGSPRRFRAKAAKGARTRAVILCKDGSTSNTPGATACARHGGINKGSQTSSAPPIMRQPKRR
jgi:hypothetical protein